jgi:hypothetical protein
MHFFYLPQSLTLVSRIDILERIPDNQVTILVQLQLSRCRSAGHEPLSHSQGKLGGHPDEPMLLYSG